MLMKQLTNKNLFKIALTVFLIYLAIYYWPTVSSILELSVSAVFPLVLGGAIAYVINILMSFYERHFFPKSSKRSVFKIRRFVCLALALVTLVALIALVAILIIPQLTKAVSLIISELPEWIKKLISFLERTEILSDKTVDSLKGIDWQSKIGEIVSVLGSGVGSAVTVIVDTVFSLISWVVSVFLALIFAIYLLAGKERICSQFTRLLKRFLSQKHFDGFVKIKDLLHDCFRKFIVGQCVEALILGVLCALGMLILRLPYAGMVGTIVGFTAIIPIAGAYIGGAVGAFMILTVSPVKALIFVAFLVILQELEGNLIYPRVVGSSIGLPAIWVLAAITVGGGLMGVAGMLLSVPLAAALWRALKYEVNKGKEKPSTSVAEAVKESQADLSSEEKE